MSVGQIYEKHQGEVIIAVHHRNILFALRKINILGNIKSRVIFSHKKEWNIAICSNMDGPTACHTKWSKSEKDKYDITYRWDLKKIIHINIFTKEK